MDQCEKLGSVQTYPSRHRVESRLKHSRVGKPAGRRAGEDLIMMFAARIPNADLRPARAVIDIGSNTVRLVIYGGPQRAPIVLHNEKVTARLGRGLAEKGCLSRKSVVTALAALARFRALLDLQGLEQVEVVATAAVRDARDGRQFLEQVAALGFRPSLLSGQEEAEFSAHGVMAAFPGAQGIVADLGGGSLELIDIDQCSCRHGVSLPLGTLCLAQLRERGARWFSRFVARQLEDTDWKAEPGSTLYLVGGSFRSFGKLALSLSQLPLDDPHGHAIDHEAAAKLARNLARMAPDEISPVTGISASRLAAMPHAAALLESLLHCLEPGRVVFSAWGLREGLLYSSLDPAIRTQDPLLSGVSAFAARQGVSTVDATAVAGWTALGSDDFAPTANERLRLAATLLAMATGSLEPNLRATHGIDWAMRKRWVGIERNETAMLAACVLASCGKLAVPPDLASLASPDRIHQAQGWGLATRLCRRLCSFSVRSLIDSSLHQTATKLVLTVSPPLAMLVNDGVERDLRQLALHLGPQPVWQLPGQSQMPTRLYGTVAAG